VGPEWFPVVIGAEAGVVPEGDDDVACGPVGEPLSAAGEEQGGLRRAVGEPAGVQPRYGQKPPSADLEWGFRCSGGYGLSALGFDRSLNGPGLPKLRPAAISASPVSQWSGLLRRVVWFGSVDDAVDGGAADAVFLGEIGQGHLVFGVAAPDGARG
jgi:hypothetical protein